MVRSLPKGINAYQKLGPTPIPIRSKDKQPLVKWRNGWNPTYADREQWALKPGINWAVRCDRNFGALGFDSEHTCYHFIAGNHVPQLAL